MPYTLYPVSPSGDILQNYSTNDSRDLDKTCFLPVKWEQKTVIINITLPVVAVLQYFWEYIVAGQGKLFCLRVLGGKF